ncbi:MULTISPECIES: hypothetical protein [unclassified Rathayibacter]|uniref:hypothetical protein n=1 Tax=unclassified Rathayibacter TaxID=2609250 RepID=UPI0006FF082F|nr:MULTISPECIES: hypothetical protein [unclassified Rathayibacter]KQQ05576.1 hypothetical protein ASF42_03130 [Rathayibacter sp. Leaf294]KQS13437.1 hypothetical protein ASG06_03140 [Rathayibacter sp. Leaf185]
MTDLEETPTESTGPSRRRIAEAAGWSVPLVIAAVGAPAAQASTTPPPAFEGLTGFWGAVSTARQMFDTTFTVVNTGTSNYDFNSMTMFSSNRAQDGHQGALVIMGLSGYIQTNEATYTGRLNRSAGIPCILYSIEESGVIVPGGQLVIDVSVGRNPDGIVELVPALAPFVYFNQNPAPTSFPPKTFTT